MAARAAAQAGETLRPCVLASVPPLRAGRTGRAANATAHAHLPLARVQAAGRGWALLRRKGRFLLPGRAQGSWLLPQARVTG